MSVDVAQGRRLHNELVAATEGGTAADGGLGASFAFSLWIKDNFQELLNLAEKARPPALMGLPDLTEAKKLFEAYGNEVGYCAPPAVLDFLLWCDKNFIKLVGWAAQEPMAHQLADVDQALTELEMAVNEQPMERLAPITVGSSGNRRPLRDYLQMLRAAVEGKDYQR